MTMYEGWDYEDLDDNMSRVEEIISHLRSINDLLQGAKFVGKTALEDYINDAMAEATDDKTYLDEAMTKIAKEEEAAEIREYARCAY